MKTIQYQHMSETFLLGSLLAIIGGFLDAYTYILRGGVFANAQTGNIVLLGINLAEGSLQHAFYYLIPILAFILGVLVTEIIKGLFKEHPNIHWRQIVIFTEALILCIVAFIPQGDLDQVVNVVISFICSMQFQSFRKVRGNSFATTMCTGNLRSATEGLYKYGVTKNGKEIHKSLQYYGIILFFIGGAVLGTFMTNAYLEKAILFCCMILMIVFGLMFIKSEGEEQDVNYPMYMK